MDIKLRPHKLIDASNGLAGYNTYDKTCYMCDVYKEYCKDGKIHDLLSYCIPIYQCTYPRPFCYVKYLQPEVNHAIQIL
jgi:hypothetical protein